MLPLTSRPQSRRAWTPPFKTQQRSDRLSCRYSHLMHWWTYTRISMTPRKRKPKISGQLFLSGRRVWPRLTSKPPTLNNSPEPSQSRAFTLRFSLYSNIYNYYSDNLQCVTDWAQARADCQRRNQQRSIGLWYGLAATPNYIDQSQRIPSWLPSIPLAQQIHLGPLVTHQRR